ncbi:MAG: Spo0B domain-containing protein [Eubacteriales bacterium]|jgi:sensor histidine kinase regulating citrate/malate metabolism|nr:Spo0B domain-containing protein [Bacillota bacterium]MBV1727386.1 Spo0B domain-containing protein [Desulforudis sp.]MDQ7790408.1 Spo0B domain-containing protein [Clostridia bacterium]MDZ4043723.1 Spo0B domain-containing protein [Eubacteriales bacterium]MBU4532860.1 Spo0B domain-containing protein [Bacillota bacterium]
MGPPPGHAVDNDDWSALNRSYFLVYLLAVLVLTALTPIKIQAIGRAVADACTARKTAENLAHIGELLQLVRRQHHDFHHQLQTVYGLLETGYYEEARQHIRKTFFSRVPFHPQLFAF